MTQRVLQGLPDGWRQGMHASHFAHGDDLYLREVEVLRVTPDNDIEPDWRGTEFPCQYAPAVVAGMFVTSLHRPGWNYPTTLGNALYLAPRSVPMSITNLALPNSVGDVYLLGDDAHSRYYDVIATMERLRHIDGARTALLETLGIDAVLTPFDTAVMGRLVHNTDYGKHDMERLHEIAETLDHFRLDDGTVPLELVEPLLGEGHCWMMSVIRRRDETP